LYKKRPELLSRSGLFVKLLIPFIWVMLLT
jgi:hypothetical protein